MKIDRVEWTPNLIEKLTLLWNQGLSSACIGKELGITKNSAIGKIHRLGLPSRQSPIKRMKNTPKKSESENLQGALKTKIAAAPVIEKMREKAAPRRRLTEIDFGKFENVKLSKEPCQYPMWQERKDVGRLYCRRPSVEGKTYCPQHDAMCHVPTRAVSNMRAFSN